MIKFKIDSGFTIIELFVTIAIIGVLSSVVFMSRGDIDKDLGLQRYVYKLSQDFREAQEMAMGSWSGSCGAGKDVCGFGIFFEEASYGFFADCAPSCDTSNNRKDGQDDILFEKQVYESGIEITDTNPNNLSVLFTPPDPIVYINAVEWNSEAVITFGVDSKTKDIKINSAGRVEIE